MKTAIIYASKHGTTEKIAVSIAEKLKETNEVVLFSLKKNANPDISGFEIVILGSYIYMGQASGKMKNFCQKNESALLQKKTGLFVCGMHPDKTQREKELKETYPEVLRKNAAVTEFMGGEFLFEQLNFFEKLIIKKVANVTTSASEINWNTVNMFVNRLK